MAPAPAGQFVAGYGRWQFAIGDRNAVAWLTVAAYAIAAVLSFRAFLTGRALQREFAPIDRLQARDQMLVRRLWLAIAITMVVQGINKQLDLQSLLIQIVRDRAVEGGWYDDRRGYQTEFIVVVAVLGMVATIILAVVLRRVLRRVLLAVAGLGMLVSFVVIRAASFHNVDKVLALGSHVRVNWILEFAGIGLIAVAAVQWRWTERKRIKALTADAVPPDPVRSAARPEPSEL